MLSLIYPFGLLAIVEKGGWWLWALVPLNIAIIPLLDHGLHWIIPNWRPNAAWLQVLFAKPVFWFYAVVQGFVLVTVLLYVSHQHLSALGYMGLMSSTGIMTGTAGITAAHELIHRQDRMERALGLALLSMVSYMHFRIEHVYGHHKHVGTDQDSASAKIGDDFPAFFIKILRRGLVSAWNIECARLLRVGQPVFSFQNRVIQYLVIQGSLCLGIGIILGLLTLAFFLLQSLMAVHLLEAVNYVQHYGLRRELAGTATAVRPGPLHAWESDYVLAGLFYFRIDVHAQHHIAAGRHCTVLQNEEKSPKLPFSFNLMVFIALVPPLWHRLMDPLAARQSRFNINVTDADVGPLHSLHL